MGEFHCWPPGGAAAGQRRRRCVHTGPLEADRSAGNVWLTPPASPLTDPETETTVCQTQGQLVTSD